MNKLLYYYILKNFLSKFFIIIIGFLTIFMIVDIIDNLDKFKPEVILISSGFDAHERDPLSNINLKSKDYYTITKNIVDIANNHSNGKIISFLEGGYDLLALSESIKEHIFALIE